MRSPSGSRVVDLFWWSNNRQLALLLVAYLSALASILSYVVFNSGTGSPTKLQILLMVVPVCILYYLGVSLTPME